MLGGGIGNTTVNEKTERGTEKIKSEREKDKQRALLTLNQVNLWIWP